MTGMPVARSPAGAAVAREDGVERDADDHGWGRCVLMAAPTATQRDFDLGILVPGLPLLTDG